MSNLSDLKRELFTIKESFENGSFNLSTVSTLIGLIKDYYDELTEEQAILLLEIPLSVLKNDVELRDMFSWRNSRKGYFIDSIKNVETEFAYTLKSKISSGKFDLEDVYSIIEYVQSNFKELSKLFLSIEELLRIPTTTVLFDVELNSYSNFNTSGKAFAANIEQALK